MTGSGGMAYASGLNPDDSGFNSRLPDTSHRWSWCEVCHREMVICGKCGNNCCSGGYGELPDGSQCDACPAAYEQQAAERPQHLRRSQ